MSNIAPVSIGGIVLELLSLIGFLVRVPWWLSHRFTMIDASFMTVWPRTWPS